MYCKFFKFSEMPFDLTPDPKFLYLSPGHREILDSLISGIRERLRLIVLVGKEGVGKDTLLRAATARLDENTKTVQIVSNDSPFENLLAMALVELGVSKPEEDLPGPEALHRLKRYAEKQFANDDNVVFVIKDAQNLDNQANRNLEHLSDLEIHNTKLVQVIFSGTPELEANLGQLELGTFTNSVNLRLRISPLTEEETHQYIYHRLAIANYKGPHLFETRALEIIWEYSGGVPQKINMLCDNALLIGYGKDKKGIEAGIVEEAIKDLNWKPFSGRFEAPIAVPKDEHVSQENIESYSPDKTFHLSKIFGLLARYCSYLVEWFSGHGKRLLEKVREIVDRFILPPHVSLAGGLVAALCIIIAVWLFSGNSEVDRRAGDSVSALEGVGAEVTRAPDSAVGSVRKQVERNGGQETEVATTVEEIPETEIPSAMEQVVEKQESSEVSLVEKREEFRTDFKALAKVEGGDTLMEGEIPALPIEERLPVTSRESDSVKEEKPDEKKTTVSTLKPESKRKGTKTGKVILQLGAFREKRAAEGVKRRLMDKGYDAYLEEVEVKGKGSLHRVRIRCCSNLTEARGVKAQLRKQGFSKSFILGQKKY